MAGLGGWRRGVMEARLVASDSRQISWPGGTHRRFPFHVRQAGDRQRQDHAYNSARHLGNEPPTSVGLISVTPVTPYRDLRPPRSTIRLALRMTLGFLRRETFDTPQPMGSCGRLLPNTMGRRPVRFPFVIVEGLVCRT